MTEFTQAILLSAFGGFCIGVGLTWLFTRGQSKANQELTAARDELQQYRAKVERHFIETAHAVDELNQSYQNVFNHLSQGAAQLMNKESYRREAEKRRGQAVTLAYLSQTDAPTVDAPERPVPADAPELPQNSLDGINAASNASPVFENPALTTTENATEPSSTDNNTTHESTHKP